MPASNLARVKRRWKTPSVLVGSGVTAAGAIWRGSFQLPGLGGDKRIMAPVINEIHQEAAFPQLRVLLSVLGLISFVGPLQAATERFTHGI